MGKKPTSSVDSPTAAGRRAEGAQYSDALIDAINTLFTQFEVAFPNLYHRAYPTDNSVILAKQLWAKSLCRFSAPQILAAAQSAIESSDYIPTIHAVLKFCEDNYELHGLPSPRRAYIEACNAPVPKHEYAWSHPVVYFAGRESDWFFLANNSESKALPVFEANYRRLCQRVFQGEEFAMPNVERLASANAQPLSKAEQRERLRSLRDELGL